MKATFLNGKPVTDYRGAHVVTPDQKLGEITEVFYLLSVREWRATLRHFNGEPFPDRRGYALASLEILERDPQ